ncbi:hypothetical protein BN1232_06287 [Mycobacterium lentiflavum]|uniref:Uncharacterized protein n=2 Tax=Mycobacterium simiae complex TaxID=2249310 RepID=A0A0E4CRH0_MYCLN|nr:hypothetical protein B5M45_27105 [Mycobacterium simiae]CQD24609.1 hypothetical protein BN1232_06287 [Mycobacterium lentiflavum]
MRRNWNEDQRRGRYGQCEFVRGACDPAGRIADEQHKATGLKTLAGRLVYIAIDVWREAFSVRDVALRKLRFGHPEVLEGVDVTNLRERPEQAVLDRVQPFGLCRLNLPPLLLFSFFFGAPVGPQLFHHNSYSDHRDNDNYEQARP